MSTQIQLAARSLVRELLALGATRDKISASRSALSKLRQAIQDPILAAPYVAPATQHLNEKQEKVFYLVASLFAINPNHQAGVSFGGAFRHLREKSDSMETRFNMVLAARREQLPDLMRHSVRLLSVEAVALDWEMLLLDLVNWDSLESTVQRKWARDFYRNSGSQHSEKTGGDES